MQAAQTDQTPQDQQPPSGQGSEFTRLLGVRPTVKQLKILAYLFERAYVDGHNDTLATTLSRRINMDHKTLFLVLPSLNGRGLIHYGGLGYSTMDWHRPLPGYRRKHEQHEISIQPGALDVIATMLTSFLWPGHVAWYGLGNYNQHKAA